MRKTKKCVGWAIAIVIALALLVLAIILTLKEIDNESITCTIEDLYVPVEESFSFNAATIDAYLRANYPDDCARKELTHMELQAYFLGQELLSGTLEAQYYRFMDESREGGNIEATHFAFDMQNRALVKISREHGSAKGMTYILTEPVCEDVMDFPLELYIENFGKLMETPLPPQQSRMLISVSNGGLWMKAFYKPDTHGYDYCEVIHEWTSGTPFAEREFTEIEK